MNIWHTHFEQISNGIVKLGKTNETIYLWFALSVLYQLQMTIYQPGKRANPNERVIFIRMK